MNFMKVLGKPELEIRLAWIAAIVVAGGTLCGILIGLLNRWNFLDVLLSLALAYGIYRRSRVCAVLMLCNFLANRVFVVMQFHKLPGAEALFLGVAFILGVHGTLDYHRDIERIRVVEELRARYEPPDSRMNPPAGGGLAEH